MVQLQHFQPLRTYLPIVLDKYNAQKDIYLFIQIFPPQENHSPLPLMHSVQLLQTWPKIIRQRINVQRKKDGKKGNMLRSRGTEHTTKEPEVMWSWTWYLLSRLLFGDWMGSNCRFHGDEISMFGCIPDYSSPIVWNIKKWQQCNFHWEEHLLQEHSRSIKAYNH